MMQRDREFGQFLRRSLHAAAESVVVGEDGLDRIRSRMAEMRRAAEADSARPLRRGTTFNVGDARVHGGKSVTTGKAGPRREWGPVERPGAPAAGGAGEAGRRG